MLAQIILVLLSFPLLVQAACGCGDSCSFDSPMECARCCASLVKKRSAPSSFYQSYQPSSIVDSDSSLSSSKIVDTSSEIQTEPNSIILIGRLRPVRKLLSKLLAGEFLTRCECSTINPSCDIYSSDPDSCDRCCRSRLFQESMLIDNEKKKR